MEKLEATYGLNVWQDQKIVKELVDKIVEESKLDRILAAFPNDILQNVHDALHGNKGGGKNREQLVAAICAETNHTRDFGVLNRQCVPVDLLRRATCKHVAGTSMVMLKAMKKAEIVQWLASTASADTTKKAEPAIANPAAPKITPSVETQSKKPEKEQSVCLACKRTHVCTAAHARMHARTHTHTHKQACIHARTYARRWPKWIQTMR